MAAWNSTIHKLVNTPMDKIDYDKELDLVIDIAEYNRNKKDLILKLGQKSQIGQTF